MSARTEFIAYLDARSDMLIKRLEKKDGRSELYYDQQEARLAEVRGIMNKLAVLEAMYGEMK